MKRHARGQLVASTRLLPIALLLFLAIGLSRSAAEPTGPVDKPTGTTPQAGARPAGTVPQGSPIGNPNSTRPTARPSPFARPNGPTEVIPWHPGNDGTLYEQNSPSYEAYRARTMSNEDVLRQQIEAAEYLQSRNPQDPKLRQIVEAGNTRLTEIQAGGPNAPVEWEPHWQRPTPGPGGFPARTSSAPPKDPPGASAGPRGDDPVVRMRDALNQKGPQRSDPVTYDVPDGIRTAQGQNPNTGAGVVNPRSGDPVGQYGPPTREQHLDKVNRGIEQQQLTNERIAQQKKQVDQDIAQTRAERDQLRELNPNPVKGSPEATQLESLDGRLQRQQQTSEGLDQMHQKGVEKVDSLQAERSTALEPTTPRDPIAPPTGQQPGERATAGPGENPGKSSTAEPTSGENGTPRAGDVAEGTGAKPGSTEGGPRNPQSSESLGSTENAGKPDGRGGAPGGEPGNGPRGSASDGPARAGGTGGDGLAGPKGAGEAPGAAQGKGPGLGETLHQGGGALLVGDLGNKAMDVAEGKKSMGDALHETGELAVDTVTAGSLTNIRSAAGYVQALDAQSQEQTSLDASRAMETGLKLQKEGVNPQETLAIMDAMSQGDDSLLNKKVDELRQQGREFEVPERRAAAPIDYAGEFKDKITSSAQGIADAAAMPYRAGKAVGTDIVLGAEATSRTSQADQTEAFTKQHVDDRLAGQLVAHPEIRDLVRARFPGAESDEEILALWKSLLDQGQRLTGPNSGSVEVNGESSDKPGTDPPKVPDVSKEDLLKDLVGDDGIPPDVPGDVRIPGAKDLLDDTIEELEFPTDPGDFSVGANQEEARLRQQVAALESKLQAYRELGHMKDDELAQFERDLERYKAELAAYNAELEARNAAMAARAAQQPYNTNSGGPWHHGGGYHGGGHGQGVAAGIRIAQGVMGLIGGSGGYGGGSYGSSPKQTAIIRDW